MPASDTRIPEAASDTGPGPCRARRDPVRPFIPAAEATPSLLCPLPGCETPLATGRDMLGRLRHWIKPLYPCALTGCNQYFLTLGSMQAHSEKHARQPSYICQASRCGQLFASREAWQMHQLCHTHPTSFICPFNPCRKTFSTREGWASHIRRHTGEKPYPCPRQACGRRFVSGSALSCHLNARINAPCLQVARSLRMPLKRPVSIQIPYPATRPAAPAEPETQPLWQSPPVYFPLTHLAVPDPEPVTAAIAPPASPQEAVAEDLVTPVFDDATLEQAMASIAQQENRPAQSQPPQPPQPPQPLQQPQQPQRPQRPQRAQRAQRPQKAQRPQRSRRPRKPGARLS